AVDIDFSAHLDRKDLRFMRAAAAYGYLALDQAIKDSGLSESEVSNIRTGIIMGAGGSSTEDMVETADVLREKRLKRIGHYRVTRTMGSTVSACLATPFRMKGVYYSLPSHSATSAHCNGIELVLVLLGNLEKVVVGGGQA